MATPLFLVSTNTHQTQPDDKPAPRPNLESPKLRGRRAGKSKQGGPKKQAQRGMGVAQLERLLSQQQQQQPGPDPGSNPGPVPEQFPYQHVNPLLAGYPIQPGRLPHYGPRSAFRAAVGSTALELPSMPNMVKQESTYVDHFLKKKRVVGDEVGFMRGKDQYDYDQINALNYSGFDLNNCYNPHYLAHNVGFSSYDPATEVGAIHRKGYGSSMVKKEYGFFPDKSNSNSNSGENFNNESNKNGSNITYDSTNNYYNMENLLNLNMGCSSNPSLSPSSSLSSLSSNPPTPNTISLDLSLKLSY